MQNTHIFLNARTIAGIINGANWDYSYSGYHCQDSNRMLGKIERSKCTIKQVQELINSEERIDAYNENAQVDSWPDDAEKIVELANLRFAKLIADDVANSFMDAEERSMYSHYTFQIN